MKFPRVWKPCTEWEEIAFNMWGVVQDRKAALQEAIGFTGDWVAYGGYMDRVVIEWPVSCENALTDYSMNRRAWLGHAACALAIQCPEDIVRLAWGFLTDEQRTLANKAADRAISAWENSYAEDRGIHRDVGTPMLSGWYTG